MCLNVISVGYRLNVFIPTILVFLDVMSRPRHNGLLETFYMPIRLPMIRCGKLMPSTTEVAHSLEELRGQFRAIVGYQVSRSPQGYAQLCSNPFAIVS